MAKKNNNKRKYNNNKRNSKVIPEIRSTIYTNDSIEKCFGEIDNHSLLCATDPALRFYNVAGLLMQDGYEFEKLTLVVIDDEYFEWLDEEGCIDSEAARNAYITEMGSDNVERLWRKHHLYYNMNTLAFPVTYMVENFNNSNVTLSKDTIVSIKKDIAKCYGIRMEDLYVSEQAFRADYLCEHNEDIEGQIYSTFVDKDFKVELPPALFKIQKYVNVVNRFVVVAINKDLESTIDVKNLDKIEYHLDDKELKFSKNTFKCLEKDTKALDLLDISGLPLSILEVPDFVEDFNKVLKKTAKKAGVKILR